MKLILILTTLFCFEAYSNLTDVSSWVENNHIKDKVNMILSNGVKASLRRDIPGNKFIFLGESDHYFHEKYTYRIAFIKELLKMGHYNIYEEMGTASARRVNKYLETGNEDFLKQVGLFGFKYGEQLKFRDIVQVKEHVRFFRELRKLKQTYPKLKYAGFDLDMRPGTAYLDFDKFRSRPEVKEFAKKSKPFAQSLKSFEKSKTSDFQRLYLESGFKAAVKARNAGVKKIKDYDQFLHFYKNLKDSIIFDQEVNKKPFSWKVFHWREKRMFEIMDYVLKNEKNNDKYIFLGHNGHLTKTDKKNSNGQRYTDWDTIGAWITKRYPNEVFAIWSLIGRGEHRGHGCPGRKTCTIELMPGTLEESLYQISSQKGLYFKNSAIIKKNENLIKTVVNGISPTAGKYGDSADAFYFIPEVTDLRH